jgi:hypothetical protein
MNRQVARPTWQEMKILVTKKGSGKGSKPTNLAGKQNLGQASRPIKELFDGIGSRLDADL